METYWTYLLKVSAALIPFYLIYRLWLRKLTFFRMNRLFLLAALACSLVLPFLNTGRWLSSLNSVPAVSVPSPDTRPQTEAADRTIPAQDVMPGGTESSLDFSTILMLVYGVVAAVFLSMLILNLYRLYSLAKQAKEKEITGGLKIYYTEAGIANSSFFNRVFLQNGLLREEKEQILYHESRHCRLGHSADLLFLEVLKILFWFNPFIWLYKQALAELHEYEADARSAGRFSRKSYADTLLRLGSKTSLSLLHSFNGPPLSKRIRMLFKERTPWIRKLSYLLFLPLFLLAALYSGGKGTGDIQPPVKQENFDELIRSYWLDRDHLGENPLLLIDGEEYPLSVLPEVDPEKLIGSSGFPANSDKTIERFGEKARDGVISLRTDNGSFRFDSERHKAIKAAEIKKMRAIPESEMIGRYTFEDYDGKLYETVFVRHSKGGGVGASLTHKAGTKTYFYLDGKRVTEEEIESWSEEVWEGIHTRGVVAGPINDPGALAEHGITAPPGGSVLFLETKERAQLR